GSAGDGFLLFCVVQVAQEAFLMLAESAKLLRSERACQPRERAVLDARSPTEIDDHARRVPARQLREDAVGGSLVERTLPGQDHPSPFMSNLEHVRIRIETCIAIASAMPVMPTLGDRRP